MGLAAAKNDSMAIELERAGQLMVAVPLPFDFSLTVDKPAGWSWSTPTEQFEDGTLWTAVCLYDKAVGLKMRSPGPGRVSVTVYTDFDLTPALKQDLRKAIEVGLGRDQDLDGFYRFAKREKVLRKTVADLYGMRVGRMDELFGRIILAICLQMAPIKRSQEMMASLLDLYGMRADFEGRRMILWPGPLKISKTSPVELREKARLGYRADRLFAAANYLVTNPMTIRELDEVPPGEALARIREVPGIGGYSSGIVLTHFAPIDSWSAIVMSELLLGKTPEKPRDEVASINELVAKRWGKWSWLAFAYILNDLENLAEDFHLTRLV